MTEDVTFCICRPQHTMHEADAKIHSDEKYDAKRISNIVRIQWTCRAGVFVGVHHDGRWHANHVLHIVGWCLQVSMKTQVHVSGFMELRGAAHSIVCSIWGTVQHSLRGPLIRPFCSRTYFESQVTYLKKESILTKIYVPRATFPEWKSTVELRVPKTLQPIRLSWWVKDSKNLKKC